MYFQREKISTYHLYLYNSFSVLDHDISSFDKDGKEWTGKDAADYLVDKCLDTGLTFPDFFVHTMNNVGRPNIIGTILNYLKHGENKQIDWKYYNSGIINNQVI